MEPLAVEYPNEGGVAHGGVGGDGGVSGDRGGLAAGASVDVGGLGSDVLRDEIDLDSDYDEDDENDEEDVEDVEIGVRDEEQNVERDDDDWLNEGQEGNDFGDDIFAAQNSVPQGSGPNTAPESSNAPHITLESSNAFHANPE